MKARTWAWLPIVASLSLTACGKTIEWKQEVKLHDGRVIVIDRTSKLGGTRFPENVALEDMQTLSFHHPDSGDRIEWEIPKGLQPVALDLDRGLPYYVLRAYTVSDYNKWGCPNPPYFVYRYQQETWSLVPFTELPRQFAVPNLLAMSKLVNDIKSGRVVSVSEVEAGINRHAAEYRIISREKVNPIAHGCHESVLHRQGRQSEIDNRR